jgi:hypothetical protein
MSHWPIDFRPNVPDPKICSICTQNRMTTVFKALDSSAWLKGLIEAGGETIKITDGQLNSQIESRLYSNVSKWGSCTRNIYNWHIFAGHDCTLNWKSNLIATTGWCWMYETVFAICIPKLPHSASDNATSYGTFDTVSLLFAFFITDQIH